MRKLKLSELVFDYTLYPRTQVDAQHISDMTRALLAGKEFPPIVIDKASKRVTDGFHRGTMYRRQYGDDYKVEVVEKNYGTEQEMILDAIQYNASHGRGLTTHDRAHCLILGEKAKVPKEELAAVLGMTVEQVDALRVERCGELRVAGNREPLALKRTIRHKAGQTLTKEQADANGKLGGMNQSFYVNQVIILLESDLLDREDPNLMERLGVLHCLLDGVFAPA